MFKHTLIASAAAVILAAAVPAQAKPMIQIPAQQITTSATTAQVQKCIVNAALKKSWQIVENKEGSLLIRYTRGPKWWVHVKVNYSNKEYRISYVDSYGLDYKVKDGVPDIHRNYNRWILNLDKDIRVAINQL